MTCTFCGARTTRQQLSICDACIRIAHGWRPPKPPLDLRPGDPIRVKVGLKSENATVIEPLWQCDLRVDPEKPPPLMSGPMAIVEFKNGARIAVGYGAIAPALVRNRTKTRTFLPDLDLFGQPTTT